MTSAIEARHRLDKTLSSSALSDTAILNNLVRKQLLRTSEGRLITDEVVERKSSQMLKLLDDLRSAKGERTTKVVDGEWKVKQDSPRFRVMYREGPEGAPYHSLCLDGIIDGPLSHALCVGCEVPMYREWWPMFHAPTFKIVESRWLERDTVSGDYSVLRFKVPWPFAMREVILSAFELEYFDEGLVAVLYNTAPEMPDAKVDGITSDQIPTLQSNVVRMDLNGGFVLQKIGHNCSFFRTVVDLDMKLDLVPPWLINFMARQLAGHGYKLYQKAVTGVKGSKLEKLANSDPMYKRLQVLDDASFNTYEPTAVAMSPSKKVISAGLHEGTYKQEAIDSLESAFKSQSDGDLSEDPKRISEDVFLEEKQDIGAPLSGPHSHIGPILNGLSNGKHDLNIDGTAPTAETKGIQVATASVELQEQLSQISEVDGPTDPEVIWALGVLEKFIAHFNGQKAAAQTSENRDTAGVYNGTADSSEFVCSTAEEKEVQVKHSLITADVDIAKRDGSDKTIVDQQIIPLPRNHQGRFRFFKFRKRQKDKEKNLPRGMTNLRKRISDQVHEI